MFKKINVKAIVIAIVFGGLVSSGTYFFIPPTQEAYACSESRIISRILFCIDGSSIHGGTFTTYCDG